MKFHFFSFYSQVPISWYVLLAILTECSLTPLNTREEGPSMLSVGHSAAFGGSTSQRAQGLFDPKQIPRCRAHNQPAGFRPLYIIERRDSRGGRGALRVKTMHVKIFHPSPKHSRGSLRNKAGQYLL